MALPSGVSTTIDPERLGRALQFVAHHHGQQRRKGSDIPYVSHLLAVASLVLEDGGTEDEAIAGLLHDVVEDCEVTVDQVEAGFGPNVAAVVAACSDRLTGPAQEKPPWPERKAAYVAHLLDPATTPSALRVSNADKVHLLRSMLDDYRDVGPALWERFNEEARSAEAQLGNDGRMVVAFEERRPGSRLAVQLRQTYDELTALVADREG